MARVLICPYCNNLAQLIDSAFIYGRSFGKVYWCSKCGAYVGCHKKTDIPLGTLASPELRKQRQRAHMFFDQVWKSGKMTRSEAYNWLSTKLDKDIEETHIGMFDEKDCQRTTDICRCFLQKHKILNWEEIR